MQRARHEHQALRRQRAQLDGADQQIGPETVSANEWRVATGVTAERRNRLGEPVEAVGVMRPGLRVAVPGQVTQDQAVPVPEFRNQRLELPVRESGRVHQHERPPGAMFAVGDAHTAGGVEKA